MLGVTSTRSIALLGLASLLLPLTGSQHHRLDLGLLFPSRSGRAPLLVLQDNLPVLGQKCFLARVYPCPIGPVKRLKSLNLFFDKGRMAESTDF